MKYLSSYIFRAICAIIIGILLIKNPDNTLRGLTLITGFIFLVSGIVSCSSYIGIRKFGGIETMPGERQKPLFPIVGLGCLFFGAVMVFDPDFFVKFLMYIFGTVLVLGAINEFVVLSKLFRVVKLSVFFWILPSVILLCGLMVLFKPMSSAELPFIISGWCLLLYGVSEAVNAIKVYTVNRHMRNLNMNIYQKQEFSDVEDFETKDKENEVKE